MLDDEKEGMEGGGKKLKLQGGLEGQWGMEGEVDVTQTFLDTRITLESQVAAVGVYQPREEQ